MPVTTKQIAEMAGVSRGTVDRALNGRPGVSEASRRAILDIADRLGYVPNRAGKALSSARRAITVGLVLNCADNPFYDPVIAGLEACRAAYPDFNIAFRYRRLKGYSALEQLDALDSVAGADLVLLTPLSEEPVRERIDALSDAGVPVITLNSDIEHSKRLLHVGCDYVASGRTAAGLLGLLSGGRGKVGIVTGSLRMLGHSQRVEGFRSVLEREYPGLEAAWLLENNDDDRRSRELVLRQLEREPDTAALYFGAAGIPGGVEAVRESGLSPLLIASDDIPQTRELIRRGIIAATVCQEPYRQGYEALRLALEHRITGQRPEDDVVHTKNEIKIRHNL